MSLAIATREQGLYPISIATSMAIETLVDEDKQNLLGFNNLWINVRTIIRNILGAISDKDTKVKSEDIATTILNEINIITTLIEKASFGQVKVIPYYASLKSLPLIFKLALRKKPTTDIQKAAVIFEQEVLEELKVFFQDINLQEIDIKIDGQNKNSYILTHYPIDLLSKSSFSKLLLIESHTGKIKHPLMWYTKLNTGKELSNIPFNKMTLQVFGDGVVFTPMNIKFRKNLIDLSKKYHWTPMTTKDKIIMDAKSLVADPLFSKFLLDLFQ